MKQTTPGGMLSTALVTSAFIALAMYALTRDVVYAATMAAVMVPTLFIGTLASNRVANRIAARMRKPDVPVEPLAPTTDRPEHVQRLRSKRRPRGRQHPQRD
ncbi:MAG: hypothetical protein U0360_04425 [Dehalococcoidia bacterium]